MDLFNKEESAAPVAVPVAAPVVSGIECTRDSDCPVNDCENCS